MVTFSEYGTERIPIGEARAMLNQLPEKLGATGDAIALTRYNKPVLAVMSWDLFESIVETLEIMGDPDMMDALRRGIQDIQQGNLVSLEEVKAQLDTQSTL